MKGASAKADRATRPTDQAPAGLGDAATIPSAALTFAPAKDGSITIPNAAVQMLFDRGLAHFAEGGGVLIGTWRDAVRAAQ